MLKHLAMTPEQVLQTPPKVLSERQRVSYYDDGYLLVEKAIDDHWLARLRTATDEMVMSSREVTAVSYTHLTLPTTPYV